MGLGLHQTAHVYLILIKGYLAPLGGIVVYRALWRETMKLKQLGWFSKFQISNSRTACIDLICCLKDPVDILQKYRKLCDWKIYLPLDKRVIQASKRLGKWSWRSVDEVIWAYKVEQAIFLLLFRENHLSLRVQGNVAPDTVSQVVDELQNKLASD